MCRRCHECHWWECHSYNEDEYLIFELDKTLLLFGVRPGVKGIWRTELGAGLVTGSSSCNAVSGLRRLAAKENKIRFNGRIQNEWIFLRVRWFEPGVCFAGVRRCFDGVLSDFDGVVIYRKENEWMMWYVPFTRLTLFHLWLNNWMNDTITEIVR